MTEVLDISDAARDSLRGWGGVGPLEALMADVEPMQICLAGGALRNILLGNRTIPKDFDIFANAAFIDLATARLNSFGRVEYGPFGSPRWFPANDPEIYCDLIPIERFYNGLWRCEDIIDVLNQFDFTANAIAVDLRSGNFYNPVNGLRDLRSNVLRAVRFDYPDEPFAHGQVLTRLQILWFRLVHYAAKYDLAIEPVTKRWIAKHEHYAAGAEDFERLFFRLHSQALESFRHINV